MPNLLNFATVARAAQDLYERQSPFRRLNIAEGIACDLPRCAPRATRARVAQLVIGAFFFKCEHQKSGATGGIVSATLFVLYKSVSCASPLSFFWERVGPTGAVACFIFFFLVLFFFPGLTTLLGPRWGPASVCYQSVIGQ